MSVPAPSVEPICISSMANSRTRSCRSSPAMRSSGVVTATGARVDRFTVGDRVGVPWLGWTCGVCALLPVRPGESVRPGPLHRIPDRRRVCRVRRGGSALLLSASSRLRRCGGGTAALRRPDWLSRAAPGGRRQAPGAVRVRRGRAHHRAGGRHQGREIYAFTRPATWPARRSPAIWARSGPAGPTRAPPEPLDAALIFAPVGCAGACSAACRREGRNGRLRRDPHERHPGLSVCRSVGGADRSAPSPT